MKESLCNSLQNRLLSVQSPLRVSVLVLSCSSHWFSVGAMKSLALIRFFIDVGKLWWKTQGATCSASHPEFNGMYVTLNLS